MAEICGKSIGWHSASRIAVGWKEPKKLLEARWFYYQRARYQRRRLRAPCCQPSNVQSAGDSALLRGQKGLISHIVYVKDGVNANIER